MSETVSCNGCGAKVQFVKNEATGNMGPCQPIKRIYVFIGPDRVRPLKVGEPLPEYGLMISHFETCPQANLFSKTKKQEGGS